jgi:hypothetical protein
VPNRFRCFALSKRCEAEMFAEPAWVTTKEDAPPFAVSKGGWHGFWFLPFVPDSSYLWHSRARREATNMGSDVCSEKLRDGQPVFARMTLLILGWAISGLLLYCLSAFLPAAVLATIAVIAWAIVKLDRVSQKNRSLASFLCRITCLLTLVCAVALWSLHRSDHVLERLIFVGVCLGAGLILLDRRADGWS